MLLQIQEIHFSYINVLLIVESIEAVNIVKRAVFTKSTSEDSCAQAYY